MKHYELPCQPAPLHEALLDILFKESNPAVAWENWRSGVDIDYLQPGIYELLPCLYKRLRDMVPDDPWIGRLRGIYKRTWTNNITLFRKFDATLKLFRANGIEPMLLKGMSLLPDYENDPGLRMMADVDVLVPENQARASIELLFDNGWRPLRRSFSSSTIHQVHGWDFQRDGLGIDLHWHALQRKFGNFKIPGLWREAEKATLFGQPVLIPGPAHRLLLTLIHGQIKQDNRAVLWAVDTLYQLRGDNAGELCGKLLSLAHRCYFHEHIRNPLQYLTRYHQGIETTNHRPLSVYLQRSEHRLMQAETLRKTPHPAQRSLATLRALSLNSPREWRDHLVNSPKSLRIVAEPWLRWLRTVSGRDSQLLSKLKPWLDRLLVPEGPDWIPSELKPGELVGFHRGGSGGKFVGSGWAFPEPGHLWSCARNSRIVFSLDRNTRNWQRLKINGSVFRTNQTEKVGLDVQINNRETLGLKGSEACRDGFTLFINPNDLADDHRVDINLIYHHPARPNNRDTRLLGFALRSMMLESLPAWTGQESANFSEDSSFCRCLGNGWHTPETNGVWNNRERCDLLLPAAQITESNVLLKLLIVPLPDLPDKSLVIRAKGAYETKRAIELEPGNTNEIRIPLRERLNSGGIFLDFEMHRVCSPFELGRGKDRRRLGFKLIGVSLERDSSGFRSG